MKSYVTMEQRKCIVCTKDFDTNALLLDTRLRDRFEHKTVTGWGMCPECTAKKDDGFIALVGVDPTRSTLRDNPKPDEVWRTGDVVWLRESAWMFNVPIPEKRVAWVEPAVVAMLKRGQGE